jgi:ribose transport system substrate-binding protein
VKRKAAFALVFGLALSGCRSQPQPSPSSDSHNENTADQAVTRAMLAQLGNRIFSKGPNGEAPTDARNIRLSDDEISRIHGLHATAAIVLHYGGNDWSNAQVAGLRSQFDRLGIQVIAVTDAGFQPEKQVSDLENVLAMRPNIIVSIPADPAATANA